jgi:sugar lactone lactonase YvrE
MADNRFISVPLLIAAVAAAAIIFIGCGDGAIEPPGEKRESYFEVVAYFDAPGDASEDMVYARDLLWVTDSDGAGTVYQLQPDNGSVRLALGVGYPAPGPITSDGNFIYVASLSDGTIHKHSMSDSFYELGEFDTGLAEIKGLFRHGGYFYAYDKQNRTLNRFDDDFDLDETYPLVVNDKNIKGMDFANGRLWAAEAKGGWLLALDETYRIEDEFATPGPNPAGIAYDGRYLFIADTKQNRIYKLDVAIY